MSDVRPRRAGLDVGCEETGGRRAGCSARRNGEHVTTPTETATCPGWCDPAEHWDDLSDADEAGSGVTRWHGGRRIAWSDKPDTYVQIRQVVGDAEEIPEPAHIFIAAQESYPEGIYDITGPDGRRLAAALLELADELERSPAVADVEYLARLPDHVPNGRCLVHTRVRPTVRLNSRGFRAWLQEPSPGNMEACDCAWASALGPHFRATETVAKHRRFAT